MDNAGANNLLYQDRPTYTSLLLSPEHVLWLVVLEWSIDFKHIIEAQDQSFSSVYLSIDIYMDHKKSHNRSILP